MPESYGSIFLVAIWSVLIYALLVVAGGIMGYVKAGSKASLLAGLASGGVLFIAWLLMQIPRQIGVTVYPSVSAVVETQPLLPPTIGLSLAAVVALALLIFFAMRFARTRKFMPAGLLLILSLIALALFGLGIFASQVLGPHA